MHPNKPLWIPLSQRSIRLVIMDQISRALRMPNVFVRTALSKIRGLLEFQILPSTPHHYAAKIAMKRRPTSPEAWHNNLLTEQ